MAAPQRVRIDAVVPAGGQNNTSLEGVDGRFIQSALAGIRVRATVPAAAAGFVTGSAKVGSDEVTQISPIPVEVAAGRGPITDDLPFVQTVGRGGMEVFLRFSNSDVAAHTVTYIFEQIPLAPPQVGVFNNMQPGAAVG